MTRHIDKFERICGMMTHNNPSKPPTDEEKVDRFLASVKDRAYDSVNANCTDKQIEGTLTFARVIKFYTHRCFQLYPHFQLDDLKNEDKKDLSNNALTIRNQDKGKGKGKGRGKGEGKGKGRGRDNFRNLNRNRPHQPRISETRDEGKGKIDATKKANPRQQIVPTAIASLRTHAATAVATITPHVPATKDKMTKRMKNPRRLTNKPTSMYKLTRPPLCSKIPS
jgi:hypothetical protein